MVYVLLSVIRFVHQHMHTGVVNVCSARTAILLDTLPDCFLCCGYHVTCLTL